MLAPVTPGHSVARWLGRVGGSSGWVLSTQVPSLDGVKERAAERGVRVAVETRAMGHDIIQLHPLDVGVLLELDACPRGAAGPGSSPSTCMPPTGSTGPAGVASCATL